MLYKKPLIAFYNIFCSLVGLLTSMHIYAYCHVLRNILAYIFNISYPILSLLRSLSAFKKIEKTKILNISLKRNNTAI